MSGNCLVVCKSLKRASYAHRRLAEYLVEHHIPCRVIKSGSLILIDLLHEKMIIRFTSERKYEEVILGAHDWWEVTGYQVEQWLDAAEEHEKEQK